MQRVQAGTHSQPGPAQMRGSRHREPHAQLPVLQPNRLSRVQNGLHGEPEQGSPDQYLVDSGNLDRIEGKRNDSISITTNSVAQLTSTVEDYLTIKFKNTKSNNFSFCLKRTVENCEEFFDFDKCKRCEDNFILTDEFECLEYPYPRIQNCAEYSTKTLCSKCQNKFYLKDDKTQCLESIEIPNCSEYSYTVANTCIKCSSKYYQSNGSCLQRNFEFIEKCVKNAIDADGCETCDLGFTTNNDSHKCVPTIPNCLEFDRQADQVECSRCLDGFYLESGTKCSKGALAGCLLYTDQNSCSNCEHGYFLDGTTCKEHSLKSQVYNCLGFSNIYLNKCDQCDKTSVSYFNSGFCLPVDTIISGCKKYSDSLNCESCFEDSSYLSNNQCVVGGDIGSAN